MYKAVTAENCIQEITVTTAEENAVQQLISVHDTGNKLPLN